MAKTESQTASQPELGTQAQHILWLIPDKPDNISTGRQRIANGLRDRGHTVRLVDDRTEAIAQARQGYDIVMGTTAWLGAVSPLTDAKVIVDYVDPIDQLERSCGRFERAVAQVLHTSAVRTADGVLYVYERAGEEIAGVAPTAQTSLGVDYDRFADPNTQARDAATACLTAAGATGTFAVYIGGLEPTYRLPTLLDAATHIETELVIAGTGSQHDLVERRAQAQDNVTFLGVIDHDSIPGLLAQASAGVCLVDDAHTVKVLEYAAAGLPIAHITGAAERRLPSSGVAWCQDTPESVADAITTAVGTDTPQALAQFAKRHDYARVLDDYERMIHDVA